MLIVSMPGTHGLKYEEELYFLSKEITNTCEQKYILLSTQRSGSTWGCSLLDLQEGITCGAPPITKFGTKTSELLWHYGPKKHDELQWEDYKRSFDASFAKICDTVPSTAIGFKVSFHPLL